jgi:hypothetical protein
VVPLIERPSKAIADQVTTVGKQRLINYARVLTLADMRKVDHAKYFCPRLS